MLEQEVLDVDAVRLRLFGVVHATRELPEQARLPHRCLTDNEKFRRPQPLRSAVLAGFEERKNGSGPSHAHLWWGTGHIVRVKG